MRIKLLIAAFAAIVLCLAPVGVMLSLGWRLPSPPTEHCDSLAVEVTPSTDLPGDLIDRLAGMAETPLYIGLKVRKGDACHLHIKVSRRYPAADYTVRDNFMNRNFEKAGGVHVDMQLTQGARTLWFISKDVSGLDYYVGIARVFGQLLEDMSQHVAFVGASNPDTFWNQKEISQNFCVLDPPTTAVPAPLNRPINIIKVIEKNKGENLDCAATLCDVDIFSNARVEELLINPEGGWRPGGLSVGEEQARLDYPRRLQQALNLSSRPPLHPFGVELNEFEITHWSNKWKEISDEKPDIEIIIDGDLFFFGPLMVIRKTINANDLIKHQVIFSKTSVEVPDGWDLPDAGAGMRPCHPRRDLLVSEVYNWIKVTNHQFRPPLPLPKSDSPRLTYTGSRSDP